MNVNDLLDQRIALAMFTLDELMTRIDDDHAVLLAGILAALLKTASDMNEALGSHLKQLEGKDV